MKTSNPNHKAVRMAENQNVEKPALADEAIKHEVKEKVLEEVPGRKLFGTFSGVFIPTLLTILGVIMYLREGWVVGNAGLAGAWLIILLSFGITSFTALSLSSICTNIRIGAGGAFNVISQSLGLEVGGSIGIPLYISQALAVAMYIFGFRAGWLWVFPGHPPLIVDLAAFAVLFAIGFISAGLAFKVQYAILAIIIGSLVSVGAAAYMGSMSEPVQWLGEFQGSAETGFQGVGFWAVFAVFFPASTGIMAGANMSGDLKNPRKSIPIGTLSAIAVSLVIYLALAWWLAASATTEELVSNYTVMIDKSAWGPAVLAGLLGATFSSALSSLVGAPRIMQALAEHKILPGSSWFVKRTTGGEPRNAMIFTGVLVLGALMLRNLNAIAPLITMFFLVTYAMINVVVFLEQSLKLVSFRPLMRIPRLVSLLGAAGCALAMFIVNPGFGVVAVAVVLALHAYLIRKHLKAPFGDVRSGLFAAVAEWGAKKVEQLAARPERTWKANILLPVEISSQARDLYGLLKDIAYPKGFVRLLGLTGKRNYEELTDNLPRLAEDFMNEGVFANWTVIDAASFSENLAAGIEALGGAFFQSNIIFLRLTGDESRWDEIVRLIRDARRHKIGVLLYAGQNEARLAEKNAVHLILDRNEHGWDFGADLGNRDLAILTAYKLMRNWEADITLTALTEPDENPEDALNFLRSVVILGRIPKSHMTAGSEENLPEKAREASAAITLFTLSPEPDLERIRALMGKVETPCLFAMDSGLENALA